MDELDVFLSDDILINESFDFGSLPFEEEALELDVIREGSVKISFDESFISLIQGTFDSHLK